MTGSGVVASRADEQKVFRVVAAARRVGCGLAVSEAVVSSVAKVLIMDFNVRPVVSGLGSRNQLPVAEDCGTPQIEIA